jgi:chaperonin cofactor prefoldin
MRLRPDEAAPAAAAQGMRTQVAKLQELKAHVMAELRDIVHANHSAFSRTSRDIGELEGKVMSMRKLHSQLGATRATTTTTPSVTSVTSASLSTHPALPDGPTPVAAPTPPEVSPTAQELWELVGQLRDQLAVRQLDQAETTLTFAEEALREEAAAHDDAPQPLTVRFLG